jgi:hypothetical protein
MEIAFCSQELRKLCESAGAMKKKLGTDAADVLMTLLSELRAADSVDDLLEMDISPVNGNDRSRYLSTGQSLRIKVEVNHAKAPTDSDGAIAWDRVYRLKILEIQNGG